MTGSGVQRIQVDVAVGVFLVLSGITIYLLFGDETYGTACAGVGLVFVARAIARIRLHATD